VQIRIDVIIHHTRSDSILLQQAKTSSISVTQELLLVLVKTLYSAILTIRYSILYTVSQKKLCHFYFYCNFGKCWSIFKILSMSE